jgi:FKBP-type peptidyl-prolyl cis-trans isomerase FkpA
LIPLQSVNRKIPSSVLHGLYIFLAVLVTSCGNEPQPARSTRNITLMNDSLLDYNKAVVKTEDQEIEDMILRYGWKMVQSPTGLRVMIYKNGNGEKAVKGKKATIRYEIRLISGDICYSSDQKGPMEFEIGHSEAEAGIDEGILLMRVGDRAKFIVPSHLAFGLLGDQEKIPPKSTLIYDIELINLK